MKSRNNQICLILILFCFASCKKESNITVISVIQKSKSPIPPAIFPWETATYMPFSSPLTIPAPWAGAVGGIDGNIVSDFKSSDGWSMVYSTFSPTSTYTQPGGLYFALYNHFIIAPYQIQFLSI